jgi:very-short-patch-repair endonuclease
MTPPEVKLWSELRKRPGGFKFRRQHPAGPFVLDFACLSARLAIQVDGEADDRIRQAYLDAGRDEWLIAQGFSTLRIPAREVFRNLDGVSQWIEQACRSREPLHPPAAPAGPPPPAGED